MSGMVCSLFEDVIYLCMEVLIAGWTSVIEQVVRAFMRTGCAQQLSDLILYWKRDIVHQEVGNL